MKRRPFNQLPEHLRTEQNNREFYVADDPLYEPEASKFISGYIGDSSILTDEDLTRTPIITELDAVRQKYQLGVGVAYVDPDTQEYLSGVFYPDIVRHLAVNGALIDDPNRLFGVRYYAWRPPIDYDRHINFSRYFWIGAGTADDNGEYITKEVAGSQTCLYRFDGSEFDRVSVTIVNGLPGTGTTGQIVEDASTANRLLYAWNGTTWVGIAFRAIADVTDTDEFEDGDYAYVCRTGPDYNRPLVWVYKEKAGRWIATPVVVNTEQPDTPRIGMIWEDVTAPPDRVFRIYTAMGWQTLTWAAASGPTGVPANNTYRYDIRALSSITDGWSLNNWWRAYEDLSPADRSYLGADTQATRPIIEFWGNIEAKSGDTRSSRNDKPVFALYAHNTTAGEITAITTANFSGLDQSSPVGSTIYEYKPGTGTPDSVLGFAVSFTDQGEFQFDLTLESQTITVDDTPLSGYRMFRDTATGLIHSVWARSAEELSQAADSDGLYETPKNLTSNAAHEIHTDPSRSSVLNHFTSVISSQESFSGDRLGANSYRYSDQDPTIGAILIDAEASLLRPMSLLHSAKLDLPETIRQIAREYNKVMFRFFNKLRQVWESGDVSDPTDTLTVTAANVVDSIFTEIFVGRSEEFPFYYSDMGTFVETRVSMGVATVVDATSKPIFIPPSAARLGIAPVYTPEIFVDGDGVKKIRGHDGSVIPAFNDGRDNVVIELENRFFNAVPSFRRLETETVSARFDSATFTLADFYGNYSPTATIASVDEIVPDYATVTPTVNRRVFAVLQTAYAIADGVNWHARTLKAGDVFFNNDDERYYIFNGFFANAIPAYNKAYEFDYADNEFREMLRRDFERFVVSLNADFTRNTTYDSSDPFTWNYRSAGVEGHYRGIYRRIYGTIRPHSHPWEIAGYAVKPSWWTTQYVPTSTAADGTPRYANTHAMWDDLQAGIVNPISDLVRADRALIAPIPVDSDGELLDPIEAGVISLDQLDTETLDDDWTYGDGADVEQSFYDSYYFPFSVALCAYLMKPVTVLETNWSDTFTATGLAGDNTLWRAPHLVYSQTLTRPTAADIALHLTRDDDGNLVQNIGINSWIAERVVINGGSAETDFARVIENSTPSLGWRTSTFINSKRTVAEPLTGKEIPFEDVHVILHQTPAILQTFASGLIAVREGTGFRLYGYDAVRPTFRVDVGAVPAIGGQVENRQTFMAVSGQTEYTITDNFKLPQQFDTAKFSVLVNGFRVEDKYVRVTSTTTFTIDPTFPVSTGDQVAASVITAISNPSTQVKSFTVRGHTFSYYAMASGEVVDYEYGRYFETVTDVINMMIGYGRYLARQGWRFDEVDGAQAIDWLYGAKLFASWALQTAEDSQSATPSLESRQFFFSPFPKKATIRVGFGHVLNVESIRNGTYGIIGRDGIPIRPEHTFTSRVDDTLSVESTNPDFEIYGVRVYITEIMHAVFFSNRTRFNDLIYDPVLASYHRVMRIDTYGVSDWNGRLEAPGHIVSRGELLPNFEKQVFDFTRLYSRTNPVDDPDLRDQARSLYGYENKSYMDDIDADDRIKFDHHVGLAHAKGTRRAYTAFLRGTRIGTENALIREVWGWKIAEYGDVRYEQVRFRVAKNDFKNQRQVIQFTNATDASGQYINVSAFARPQNLTSDAPSHARWIIPPRASATNASTNFSFNIDDTGSVDITNYSFLTKLIDLNNNVQLLSHFHWEPQRELHEPAAMSKIDDNTSYDPARYTTGPAASGSGPNRWGDDQVGRLWLDASKLTYQSPTGVSDPNVLAREWGKLKYFRASITRTDEVVTVTTLNPYTLAAASHGLSTGQTVTISGSEQDEYNQTDVEVTVTSGTQFTFITNDQPDSPATGAITVEVGDVRVYEWVKSPVPPDEWSEYILTLTDPDPYTGDVLNVDDPSYVEIRSTDAQGRIATYYYFWVRGNRRVNPAKMMSTYDVENRLRDPQAYGLAFFAPFTPTQMFVVTDGEQVQDGYAIDIITDGRELNTHVEWIMFGESSGFRALSEIVTDKLIDSLTGEDVDGNVVPNPTLSEDERYGNENFPAQTVFRDREAAIRIYIEAVNRFIETKTIQPLDTIVEFLDLDDELTDENPDGFWERDTYRDSTIVDKTIFETVTTTDERDLRLTRKLYAPGDLVRVTQSENVDLWTNEQTGTIYRLETDQTWTEVGIENNSFRINDNLIDQPDALRSIFAKVNEIQSLTLSETNSLMFSLLHEMVRQNPLCDWFMKTSYITVQLTEAISQIPYQRPSEVDAILSHILDTKPYRAKIKNEYITRPIDEVENMSVDLTELPVTRVGLVFDRLSCNLLDDGGWDGRPFGGWDAKEWDQPIWHYDDLGRQFFRQVGTIECDGVNDTFTVQITAGSPLLFDITVRVLQNDVEIDVEEVNLEIEIEKFVKSVRITTGSVLSNQYEIQILMAQGFYEGPAPTMGRDISNEYPHMTPIESTYEHHVARTLNPGTYAPCSEMSGCDDCGAEDGGDAEERIKPEVADSVNIIVSSDWTPAYAGWDATPFDTAPFDEAPADPGRAAFVIVQGEQETIPTGEEMLPTSQEFFYDDSGYLTALSQYYEIGRVLWDTGDGNGYVEKTEGTHFEFVENFRHMIRVLPQPEVTVVINGLVSSFELDEIEIGIQEVYRNDTLAVVGVDYTITGINTLNILAPIVIGDVYRVVPRPYLRAGDQVRLLFNAWDLRTTSGFLVTTYPCLYDFSGTRLIVDNDDMVAGQWFVVTFDRARTGANPQGLSVRTDNIVKDILTTRDVYDTGIEETRASGDIFIDESDNNFYEWTGSDWSLTGPVPSGQPFFVSRRHAVYEFTGSAYTAVWTPGETYTNPPILGEPLFGRGLTYGTIAFGTMPSASTDYPDAYQVVQHPGELDG